jgi:hypothetical protein
MNVNINNLNNDCVTTVERYMKTKDVNILKNLFENFFLLSSINQIQVVYFLKNKTLLKQTLNYWKQHKIAPNTNMVKQMLLCFLDPSKPLETYKDVIDMCCVPINFAFHNYGFHRHLGLNQRQPFLTYEIHSNGSDILLDDLTNYDDSTYHIYIQAFNTFINSCIVTDESRNCINKQACLYWINMYMTKIREDFYQHHVYVLPMLEALYKTRLLTHTFLYDLWNLQMQPHAQDYRMHIADFNNTMDEHVLRAISPELHALHLDIKRWFDAHVVRPNFDNGGGWGNAHSIHKLDSFRSTYLKALHQKVLVIEESAKVQQWIGNLQKSQSVKFVNTIDARIMKSINEINTFSSQFQIEGTNDKYTMQDIFERVCFLIMNLANEWKDVVKKKYNLTDKDLQQPENIRVKNVVEILKEIEELKTQHKTTCDEATERLKQELRDMQGTCISGHINRILNSLVGYVELYVFDNEQTVKEWIETFMKDVLSEDEREELFDAMVDQEYKQNTQIYVRECLDFIKKKNTYNVPSETIQTCMIKYFGEAIKHFDYIEKLSF